MSLMRMRVNHALVPVSDAEASGNQLHAVDAVFRPLV